jgi:hypothetical protein
MRFLYGHVKGLYFCPLDRDEMKETYNLTGVTEPFFGPYGKSNLNLLMVKTKASLST